jgi:hypothetical protein
MAHHLHDHAVRHAGSQEQARKVVTQPVETVGVKPDALAHFSEVHVGAAWLSTAPVEPVKMKPVGLASA